jgi:hypothetical protein
MPSFSCLANKARLEKLETFLLEANEFNRTSHLDGRSQRVIQFDLSTSRGYSELIGLQHLNLGSCNMTGDNPQPLLD